MKMNCIAVDDEPLALGLAVNFIERTPFLNLVGAFNNALDALNVIHQNKIDIAYLDIKMPDLSGLELAKLLNQTSVKHLPKIVFTTAFNHYAIDGYKVDAIDYLLKPFNYEEFLRTANKALNISHLIHRNHNDINLKNESGDFLFVKSEYQMIKINLSEILYVEGLKDYIKIHVKNLASPILSLTTLKSFEERLPSEKFMRVQRSFIIALDKIDSISKHAVQICGTTINIGEQYKDNLKKLLSKWL
ncbi:LytR/AlgR family response regulator transcription factor [Pedobacter sp. AW1-32]|uniref:LytR/AlgR family response regulator transcription factor n=1 Tax=Pedobacter sp. AW1-32 TaxID=3383026 RepID=UPI003FF0EB74